MLVSYPCSLLRDRCHFITWRTKKISQSLPSQHVTLVARLAISLSKQDRKARCLDSLIVHNNKKQDSCFIHKRRLEPSTLVWRPQTSWCALDQPSVITAKQAIKVSGGNRRKWGETMSHLLKEIQSKCGNLWNCHDKAKSFLFCLKARLLAYFVATLFDTT